MIPLIIAAVAGCAALGKARQQDKQQPPQDSKQPPQERRPPTWSHEGAGMSHEWHFGWRWEGTSRNPPSPELRELFGKAGRMSDLPRH